MTATLTHARPLVAPLQGWRARALRSLGHWGAAALRCLPPETAHDAASFLLRSGVTRRLGRPLLQENISSLAVTVPGLGDLLHPIGLAAGFDKNGTLVTPLADLGFSFLEVGTVTPLVQPGHPKPRLFRYPAQRALVNRMELHSDGAHAVFDRLRGLHWAHDPMPLGINVGKNKHTPAEVAVEDFVAGLEMFRELGRFFVVNLSSSHNEGLPDFADEHFVRLLAERKRDMLGKIWIKLDPDMPRAPFQRLVEVIADCGFQGLVLTNTHKVRWPELGGMSGHPLSIAATTRLEWAHEVHKGRLAMIGCGGVLSGADIFEKLARGAACVEIYTAFIYRGPFAVIELLEELIAELRSRGFTCVADAIGSHYHDA